MITRLSPVIFLSARHPKYFSRVIFAAQPYVNSVFFGKRKNEFKEVLVIIMRLFAPRELVFCLFACSLLEHFDGRSPLGINVMQFFETGR